MLPRDERRETLTGLLSQRNSNYILKGEGRDGRVRQVILPAMSCIIDSSNTTKASEVVSIKLYAAVDSRHLRLSSS